MAWLRRMLVWGMLVPAVLGADAQAQGGAPARHVEFRFTPTPRAQMALWVERPDGTFVATIRLTEAVAYRGIGNRPGATQMNTGFRYPYGRREGVLPVWAHRRYVATGEMFPRVFFWGRTSIDGVHSGEGYASIHSDPSGANTIDNYFCLSFTDANNALDAVTCASVFRSNKGRYVTDEDVSSGYAAEPWQNTAGEESWRSLTTGSLYPPRRDVADCTSCSDHDDVFHYADDARAVMPDIDAVTMATLPGDEPYTVRFTVPNDWPDGDYVAWLEVSTEADYNDTFNAETYGAPAPDPSSGDAYWDSWSHIKGIPYRGQPSVVFRVPFALTPSGGAFFGEAPEGYGDMHGLNGEMMPMPSEKITDDPIGAPGSGADRLRMRQDGTRLTVLVKASDVCAGPTPHPLCGQPCVGPDECPDAVVDCNVNHVCVDYCDHTFAGPPAVEAFEVDQDSDDKHSHEWADLRFVVPDSTRPITQYQVRYGTSPPPAEGPEREAWFESLLQAKANQIDSEMLQILEVDPTTLEPVPLPAGTSVEATAGQLSPELRYYFAIRAVDACERRGPIATADVVTTAINFETVTPCFVATAAYGTPLADDIGALRRFRDRHLANNALGRALVAAYYREGPRAAAVIRDHDWLRAAVRASLSPLVALARLID